MGGACSDNRTTIEKQVDDFLTMLKRTPDTRKYLHNKTNALTFAKAWASPVFGGSVLLPVGQLKKKRTRTNQLQN